MGKDAEEVCCEELLRDFDQILARIRQSEPQKFAILEKLINAEKTRLAAAKKYKTSHFSIFVDGGTENCWEVRNAISLELQKVPLMKRERLVRCNVEIAPQAKPAFRACGKLYGAVEQLSIVARTRVEKK